MNMKDSKIIVIEGTDGSGKQTQTRLLMERLRKEGYNMYTTSFPNYDSDSSALVKMYLGGEISSEANGVSAKAASIFYAADRYITYKQEIERKYEYGKVMVFDRYVGSNIIHQGSKVISNISDEIEKQEKLQEFITWLDNLEHNDFGIPRADVTIYLRVPVEYTIKLREGRNNKITGGEKQDIHEADTNHLKNAGMSGMMAADMLGWNVVECVKDGKMRTIDDIAEEVYTIVKNNI